MGAFAYAALLFHLVPDDLPDQLTLQLAEGALSTPTALPLACPLRSPSLDEAQGGALSAAPPYDDGACVEGELNSEATAYSFDVAASTVADDALALAIVPGAPGERVVFAKPDAEALTVTAGATASPTGGESTDTAAGPATEAPLQSGTVIDSGPPSLQDIARGLSASTPLDAPAVAVPQPDVDVGAPAADGAAPEGSGTDVRLAAATTDSGTAFWRLLLLGIGLAAGVTLWLRAGDEPGRAVGGVPA